MVPECVGLHAVTCCGVLMQAKLRLEMEMERLRQTHSKEIESKDDEVEEIRQSCTKKVRQIPFTLRYHSLILISKNKVSDQWKNLSFACNDSIMHT